MGKDRTSTIEILGQNETVLGSPTSGQYMVRKYEDGIEMGGEFHSSIAQAGVACEKWENKIIANPFDKLKSVVS